MTKRFTAVFLVALLATALAQGCSGRDAAGEAGKDGKPAGKAAGPATPVELVPVEIASVVTGDISSTLLLSSNLETERMTDVYSRVQGLVDHIYVEEGDYVKKDQLLMQLDPDELKLKEAGARVDYEREKNLYERKQAMFDKQLLSKEEFETAKYAVQAKEILWQEAKLNLDHTLITSPISGVIGERLRRPGDRVQPSDKLFTVINNDEMIAVVHVPEKEVGHVRKGQKAFVTSENLGGVQFPGWIKRVSPVVDPGSGTFKVTVGVRNEKNTLRPGMFVNVHIVTDTHRNTVLIPKTAVVYESDKMHVFVVRDSLARKIELQVGYQDYEKVESLTGISPQDDVIVVGQAGLKNGAAVQVVGERQIEFGSAQATN